MVASVYVLGVTVYDGCWFAVYVGAVYEGRGAVCVVTVYDVGLGMISCGVVLFRAMVPRRGSIPLVSDRAEEELAHAVVVSHQTHGSAR